MKGSKGRSKENRRPFRLIQVTDNCGSDLGGEKGSNSEYILKVELAGFVAGLSGRDSDLGRSN